MQYRKTFTERLFDNTNIFFMIVVVIVTIYPFWNQVVISFSSGYGAFSATLWPVNFSTEAYKVVLEYKAVWRGFWNSVMRTIAGTIISLVFTILTAYPLSKSKLPFRNLFTFIIFFTMLFGGGLIPTYLLIKSLKMLDTFWVLIIPGMISAWNVFIMRNFFQSIPSSLEESARIDGAGWWTTLVKIVVPLSTPVIATVALWVAVGHWNAWFDAMIYIRNPKLVTLPVLLRRIVIENSDSSLENMIRKFGQVSKHTTRQLQAAVTIIAIIPMIIVYPFVQKYFIKGIILGAIKG